MPVDQDPPRQAMEGGGFYNRNSALQASGISLALPLWEAACRTVELGASPFVIVDYASSQGRNSMLPMRIAIEEMRRRASAEVAVEVIHTDLPSNDFSSLFQALNDDPESYSRAADGVFPSAIGRTYFEQLLPPDRVHLGWNTFSMQWLSSSHFTVPDHVLAGLTTQPNVVTMVRDQLAADWRRFLELRGRELLPGGRLLTAFTAQVDGTSGWEWLLGELWFALLDAGRAGLLTQAEVDQITIPIGFRTLDDIQSPFAASGHFSSLTLERAEIAKIEDAFWGDFQRTGDARQLGQRHADTTRAWAGPTLSGFIDPSRDRARILDDVFSRFGERIAAKPMKHEPYLAIAVLAKASSNSAGKP